MILTALSQERIVQQLTDVGADYYVIKPFDIETLAERIRQVMSSHQIIKGKHIDYSPPSRDLHSEVTRLIHDMGSLQTSGLHIPQRSDYPCNRRSDTPEQRNQGIIPACG